MTLSPAQIARAGAVAAAVLLAAVTAIGIAPAGASVVASPTPTAPPSPPTAMVTYYAWLDCPPLTCDGGDGAICVGGTDCGLKVRRIGTTDYPYLALEHEIRLPTIGGFAEVHRGRVIFYAGKATATIRFRPSFSVRRIDLLLMTFAGELVHRQTIT